MVVTRKPIICPLLSSLSYSLEDRTSVPHRSMHKPGLVIEAKAHTGSWNFLFNPLI